MNISKPADESVIVYRSIHGGLLSQLRGFDMRLLTKGCKMFRAALLFMTTLIVLSCVFTTTAFAAQTVRTYNQQVTAYTSNGTACHSGKMPYQGAVAVHPQRSSDVIKFGNGPGKYPFGTSVVLGTAVPMYPGSSTRSTFTVEDTGDYGFRLTDSWVDVWQGNGPTGGTINNWCKNTFGTKRSDITFYVR